eukprot:g1106.t1
MAVLDQFQCKDASGSSDNPRVLVGIEDAMLPPLFTSFAVSLLIVTVYHIVPGLRRHPNILIYYKAIADIIWCVFTAVPLIALLGNDECFCETNSGHFVAFVTEVSLAASLLCLLMISVDLSLNARSPFTNFKKNLGCYRIWIPLLAVALGVSLIASGDIGLYLLGFCLTPYLEDRRMNPHLLVAALPIGIIGIVQLLSLLYAGRKLSYLKTTHRNHILGRRNKSVTVSMYYTLTYLFTWAVIGSFYLTLNELANVSDEDLASASYDEDDLRTIGKITAICYALQPCPIAVVWIVVFGGPIKVKFRHMLGFGKKKTGGDHDAEDIEDLAPQLNEALREEMVEYLKFGFESLFDDDFVKIRDTVKDQISIYIDPHLALNDVVKRKAQRSWSKDSALGGGNVGLEAEQERGGGEDGSSGKRGGQEIVDENDNVAVKRWRSPRQRHSTMRGMMRRFSQRFLISKMSTKTTTFVSDRRRENAPATLQRSRLPGGATKTTTTTEATKSPPLDDVVEASVSVVSKEVDDDKEGTADDAAARRKRKSSAHESTFPSSLSSASVISINPGDIADGEGGDVRMLESTLSPTIVTRQISTRDGYEKEMEEGVVISTAVAPSSKRKGRVVFQEKMTSVFHKLRAALGLEKTFTTEMRQISAGMETNGRSGSFFFFTKGKLFCLKTMSRAEYEVLHRLVKPTRKAGVIPYCQYVKSHPNSLIVKILGAYKLTINDYNFSTYLYVMQNVFPPPRPGVVIGEKYDIKGSAGEGPPFCAGPVLYRRSLPPKPGTLCRCKHCGQKFIVRKRRLEGVINLSREIVYWPEQLKSIRGPDMVEYNFSEAPRLRFRLQASERRRKIKRAMVKKKELNAYSDAASEPTTTLASSSFRLAHSSSSSSVLAPHSTGDVRRTSSNRWIDNVIASSQSMRDVTEATKKKEIHHRMATEDLVKMARASKPQDPQDWRQASLLGQRTPEGRQVLVDVESGLRFAIFAQVNKYVLARWATTQADLSPFPGDDLHSEDDNSGEGGDDDGNVIGGSIKSTVAPSRSKFQFCFYGADGGEREEEDGAGENVSCTETKNGDGEWKKKPASAPLWLDAENVTPTNTANPDYAYFQNSRYGAFRVSAGDLVRMGTRHEVADASRSTTVTLIFSAIRPSRCQSRRDHEPVRDMLDGDLTQTILLEPGVRDRLVRQIKEDSLFLSYHGVMDYSLLLGVQQQSIVNENDAMVRDMLSLRADRGISVNALCSHYAHSQTYYMGIIDLLRVYDKSKVVENFNKRYLCCRGDRISAVPPSQYRQFFVDFLCNQVFPPRSQRRRRQRRRRQKTTRSVSLRSGKKERGSSRVRDSDENAASNRTKAVVNEKKKKKLSSTFSCHFGTATLDRHLPPPTTAPVTPTSNLDGVCVRVLSVPGTPAAPPAGPPTPMADI